MVHGFLNLDASFTAIGGMALMGMDFKVLAIDEVFQEFDLSIINGYESIPGYNCETGKSMTRSREKAWAKSGSGSALRCRALRMSAALRKSAALRAALREFQADPDELAGMDPATQAGVLSLLEEGMRQRLLAAEADCQFVDFVRRLAAQDKERRGRIQMGRRVFRASAARTPWRVAREPRRNACLRSFAG